ncbi:universal stress protein [Prauserella alba]|uniref:Universal stress protein n=1 Tax=Prauserella alba TaxID=176898 RepID=A0ABN1VP78_9PSEU|nr:universal stress protein [Prauserella alba]MCP2180879.1 Nucleotide-binding universal stress protein, UspA family [Prauserella alba]
MHQNEHASAQRIIVGFDGSPSADRTLQWATEHVGRCGGEVEVIAVRERDDLLPGTSYTFQPHGRRAVRDEVGVRDYLHETVIAAVGEAPVTESVVTGDPAIELVKASADADLLVVGAHRRGALSEMLLGSTSAECIRHAHCPVVVIPAGLDDSDGFDG